MKWTVSRAPVACGYCGASITPDAPFAIKAGKLIRCPRCAGEPVNDREVDLERFRLEQDAQRESRGAGPAKYAPRIAPPRAPIAAADVYRALEALGVTDPRLAQTGDRE